MICNFPSLKYSPQPLELVTTLFGRRDSTDVIMFKGLLMWGLFRWTQCNHKCPSKEGDKNSE